MAVYVVHRVDLFGLTHVPDFTVVGRFGVKLHEGWGGDELNGWFGCLVFWFQTIRTLGYVQKSRAGGGFVMLTFATHVGSSVVL